MPHTPHIEKHFMGSQTIRDIVVGMSDGLTVSFALAAGLSGAVANSHIVVTAGLAEIAAGSIAMGLGGYMAARGDAEHYASERTREEREVVAVPEAEAREVEEIFAGCGVTAAESAPVVAALRQRPARWVDIMMTIVLSTVGNFTKFTRLQRRARRSLATGTSHGRFRRRQKTVYWHNKSKPSTQ